MVINYLNVTVHWSFGYQLFKYACKLIVLLLIN